jgi:hypothetical protein
VFDGSKLGIEPHAVEITPAGDLIVLDSINSNIYRVQLPLSPCEHALPPTTPCPFQFFQVLASCHRTVGQDDMSSTKDGRKEQQLTELLIEFSRCNTLDYLST